jgi:hypothetical protein
MCNVENICMLVYLKYLAIYMQYVENIHVVYCVIIYNIYATYETIYMKCIEHYTCVMWNNVYSICKKMHI